MHPGEWVRGRRATMLHEMRRMRVHGAYRSRKEMARWDSCVCNTSPILGPTHIRDLRARDRTLSRAARNSHTSPFPLDTTNITPQWNRSPVPRGSTAPASQVTSQSPGADARLRNSSTKTTFPFSVNA